MDNNIRINELSKESKAFPLICEMMRHSKVEEGRVFLSLLNNIIDTVSTWEPNCDDGLNIHVISIPLCPDWAKELAVRFFIHKVALTQDSSIISLAKRSISDPLIFPYGVSGKSRQGKLISEERLFLKRVVKLFSDVADAESKAKTLFITSENDIITRNEDRNPWLNKLYGRSIDSECAAIVSTDLDGYKLEDLICDRNTEDIPIIENLYVFHTQNKGKLTSSFNIEQIDRLNQYGLGLKNIIVFNITDRPFRLYHTIDNIKNRICSWMLNKDIKAFDAFNGFVTFTSQESDSMFNRPIRQYGCIIDPKDRESFTVELDAVFDQLPHNYKFKNELLLAFTKSNQDHFVNDLKDSIGYVPQDILGAFFSYYSNVFNEVVVPQINDFIGSSPKVTFILPNNCKWAKSSIFDLFGKEKVIEIKAIDDFKVGIHSPKIVFLPYRYTDLTFKSFPNSFDPLPLSPGQEALIVINRLTHNSYYEWNKHFYDKDLNGLLYSDYRKELMEWHKKVLQRPSFPEIWNNTEEAEQEKSDYSADMCTVVYSQGKERDYLATSNALFEVDGRFYVDTLKELSYKDVKQLLVLNELVDVIRETLISKNKDNSKAEEYIRKDPQYGLSPTEISSSVELWKYLLKRKIDQFGNEEVYLQLFNGQADISPQGFERWVDFNYPIILPRSRKSQHVLLKYLGFSLGSPYHRIILAKKLLSINDTRRVNNQIESFLSDVLTAECIDDIDFDSLKEKHLDIILALDIKNISDINTLIELLDFSLYPIQTIMYDQD